MLQYSICAFLAPALASAAAFPWALPEPTFVIPAQDNWSPAPTKGPEIGAIELFRRAADDNTCGYISAKEASSLTCNNSNYVCATNTFYGVHGCCDPNSISACSIPTTCIPSSLMSASCTDAACTSNEYIAKCTASDAPSCYEWRYVYSTRTVMTEHGCASSGFTISVQRTFSDGTTSSALPSDAVVSSAAASSSSSAVPTSTDASTTTNPNARSATASPSATSGGSAAPVTQKKSSNIGPIVGGVVGGLAVLGALAFAIVFLILRNKKAKQNAANAATGANQPMMGPAPGVTEYKPQDGYPSPGPQYPPTAGQQFAQPGQYPPAGGAAGYFGQENKAWQQQGASGQEIQGQHPYSPPGSPAPQYAGPGATQPIPFGQVAPVEAGGTAIPGHPQQSHPPAHPVYEAP